MVHNCYIPLMHKLKAYTLAGGKVRIYNLRLKNHHNSIMFSMSYICIIIHLKKEGAPSLEPKYFSQKISNLVCRHFIGHINHHFNRKMKRFLLFIPIIEYITFVIGQKLVTLIKSIPFRWHC